MHIRVLLLTSLLLFALTTACTQAPPPAPDLRESAIALDPRSFQAVVHDGALLQRGMPQFEMFSNTQVNQLYAYIRSRARVALESRAK